MVIFSKGTFPSAPTQPQSRYYTGMFFNAFDKFECFFELEKGDAYGEWIDDRNLKVPGSISDATGQQLDRRMGNGRP